MLDIILKHLMLLKKLNGIIIPSVIKKAQTIYSFKIWSSTFAGRYISPQFVLNLVFVPFFLCFECFRLLSVDNRLIVVVRFRSGFLGSCEVFLESDGTGFHPSCADSVRSSVTVNSLFFAHQTTRSFSNVRRPSCHSYSMQAYFWFTDILLCLLCWVCSTVFRTLKHL